MIYKKAAIFAMLGLQSVLIGAKECLVQSEVKCIVKDGRKEFKKYQGKDCKEFVEKIQIDKLNLGKYSGGFLTMDDYPLVDVQYNLKVCNKNDKRSIKLEPDKTKVKIDKKDVQFKKKSFDFAVKKKFNNKGRIAAGKCRRGEYMVKLDTRKRYHSASSEIRAFLVDENNDVLNGGNGKEKVICEDMENHFVRFSYDTDCKIEANSKCFLEDGAGNKIVPHIPCSEGFYQTSENDCKDISVRLEWSICNGENSTIGINTSKSKYILNGKSVYSGIEKSIAAKKCQNFYLSRKVNTCDPSLTMGTKVFGTQKECKNSSTFTLSAINAFPSATPTTAPSESMIPTSSPTISEKPSMSLLPSSAPTSRPSPSPTSFPSSTPTLKPSKSSAPSKTPSLSPSSFPSPSPSDAPSMNPSVSARPSAEPSNLPTVSMMPSCVPSVSPTLSTIPSISPSNLPSTSPTDFPSITPAIDPIRRRHRNLSHKSSSKGKGGSKKGKSAKSTKNICQS